MLPRFENGIKFLLLLLLTNVSSRSYSDRYDQENRSEELDQTEHRQSNRNDEQHQKRHQSNQYRNDQQHQNRHQSNQRDVVVYKWRSSNNQKAEYDKQSSAEHSSFLSRLLNTRQGPVVVFLTPGSDKDLESQKLIQSIENEADELDNLEPYVPNTSENEAYVLYNVLRTTQQDEDLDPEAYQTFERTKNVLRAAFALRCGARSACENKCPPKTNQCANTCQKDKRYARQQCEQKCDSKPKCEDKCKKAVEKKVDVCEEKVDECEQRENKCEAKCQKVFDELDACPEKKEDPCKQKRGRTMPPHWL